MNGLIRLSTLINVAFIKKVTLKSLLADVGKVYMYI